MSFREVNDLKKKITDSVLGFYWKYPEYYPQDRERACFHAHAHLGEGKNFATIQIRGLDLLHSYGWDYYKLELLYRRLSKYFGSQGRKNGIWFNWARRNWQSQLYMGWNRSTRGWGISWPEFSEGYYQYILKLEYRLNLGHSKSQCSFSLDFTVDTPPLTMHEMAHLMLEAEKKAA